MNTYIGFHDGAYDHPGFITDDGVDDVGTFLLAVDKDGGRFFGMWGRWAGSSRPKRRRKFYLLMAAVAFLESTDEEVAP